MTASDKTSRSATPSRPRSAWFAAALIGFAGLPSAAFGDTTAPLYARMTQHFTTNESGSATGWRFNAALKPTPAGKQVPPQRRLKFVFPRGTRIDLRSVPTCAASDEQIAASIVFACPWSSRVGSGEFALFLGTASTLTVKVSLIAGWRRLITVLTTENGNVLQVLRASVERNVLRYRLPRAQAPNGYEVAVLRATLRIRKAGSAGRPLIRTPRTCPRSGRWTFTHLPRYDEPFGVQRSTSTMGC